MKTGAEKKGAYTGNMKMFDVVRDYAARYREKKQHGISIRRKPEAITIEKDVDGAFIAFLDTIKINHHEHDYTNFIKYMIDNSHMYEQDLKALESMENEINYNKLDWVKQQFLIAMSTRLIKRLKNIVDSYGWSQEDEKANSTVFNVVIPNNIDEEDILNMDNSTEDTGDNNHDIQYQVKTDYWYEDLDIQTCIKAKLIEQGLHYRENYQFVLEETIPLDTKSGYTDCIVALAPISSTIKDRPITYYFDNTIGLGNPFADFLQQIATDTSFLMKMQISPSGMISSLISSILPKANGDMLQLLTKAVTEANFDNQRLLKKIDELKEQDKRQHKRTDVFDELMPLLNSRTGTMARIIFPINRHNDHWMTAELEIRPAFSGVDVNIYIHDPYGCGIMDDYNFGLMKGVIENKIKQFRIEEIDVNVYNKKSPYLKPRQNDKDSDSCGVIVVDEIMKRIVSEDLDTENVYTVGAKDLRTGQASCIYENLSGLEPNLVSEFLARSKTTINEPKKGKSTSNNKNSRVKKCNLRKMSFPIFQDVIAEIFNSDYIAILDLLIAHSNVEHYRKIMSNEIMSRLILKESTTLKDPYHNKDKLFFQFVKKIKDFRACKDAKERSDFLKELQFLCSSESIYQYYFNELKRTSSTHDGLKLGYCGIRVASNILGINLSAFITENGKLTYTSENSNNDKISGREIFIHLDEDFEFTVLTRQFTVLSVSEVNEFFKKVYYKIKNGSEKLLEEDFSRRYKNFNYKGLTFEKIIKETHKFFLFKFDEMWGTIIDSSKADTNDESYQLLDENDGPRLLRALQYKYDEMDDAHAYCADEESDLDKEYLEKEAQIAKSKSDYYEVLLKDMIKNDHEVPFKGIPKTLIRRIMEEHKDTLSGYFDPQLVTVIIQKLKSWSGVLKPNHEDEKTRANLIIIAAQYDYEPVRMFLLQCGKASPTHKDEHNINANDYHEIIRSHNEGNIDLNNFKLQDGQKLNYKKFFAFHALRELEMIAFTYLENWSIDEYGIIRRAKEWPTINKISSFFTNNSEGFHTRKTEALKYLEVIEEARAIGLIDFIEKIKDLYNNADSSNLVFSRLQQPVKKMSKIYTSDPKYIYVQKPAALVAEELKTVKQENAQLRKINQSPHIVVLDDNMILREKEMEINFYKATNEKLSSEVDEQRKRADEIQVLLQGSIQDNVELQEKVKNLASDNQNLQRTIKSNEELLSNLTEKSKTQDRKIATIEKLLGELMKGQAEDSSDEPNNDDRYSSSAPQGTTPIFFK